MEISHFLGKIFGLYLIIVSAALLTRKSVFQNAINDFVKSPALLLFSGVIATLLGLFVTVSHNVWEVSWRVIITILGYLMLLRGITNIYVPDMVREQALKISRSNLSYLMGIVALLIGMFLTYKAFA